MKRVVLLSVLGGCGAPDSFELGYGHTWHQSGEARNEWQQVGLDSGDSDTAWAALSWDIGPRDVRVVERSHTVVSQLGLTPPDPEPAPPRPEEAPPDPAATPPDSEEDSSTVVETLEAIDAMDWLTRVLLAACLVVLGWTYRQSIGALIGKMTGRKVADEGK